MKFLRIKAQYTSQSLCSAPLPSLDQIARLESKHADEHEDVLPILLYTVVSHVMIYSLLLLYQKLLIYILQKTFLII